MVNKKGQAAVTDTLYFMLIISGLCVFVFSFSNGYGALVSERLALQYSTDYSTAALKTILYSSVPRHAGDNFFSGSDVETDHLLAVVKEHYADTGEIGTAGNLLADNIIAIMRPASGTYDYAFYIYDVDNQGIIFSFFHISKGSLDPTDLKYRSIGSPDEDEPYVEYICTFDDPALADGLQQLRTMITHIGITYSASARILFLTLVDEDNVGRKVGQADLIMWPGTDTQGDTAFKSIDWGCAEYIPAAP